MKIYIEYTEAQCRNPRSDYFRQECPYHFSTNLICRECSWFDAADEESQDCKGDFERDIVQCIERKTLEVVKDTYEGYAMIGKKEIPLNSIDLLKVDMGEGWKTLWPVDD